VANNVFYHIRTPVHPELKTISMLGKSGLSTAPPRISFAFFCVPHDAHESEE